MYAVRLPDLLVSEGVVSPDSVVEAFEAQTLYGGSFDTNLLELGVLDEKRLLPYLERALGVSNRVDVTGEPAPDALAKVPRREAETHRVVPFRINGRTLEVVCTDPGDTRAVEEIAFANGLRVQVNVAIEARVALHLYRGYGVPMPARLISVLQGKTWIKPHVSRRGGGISAPPDTGRVPRMAAASLSEDSATDKLLKAEPELLQHEAAPPRSEAELASRLAATSERDQIPPLTLGFLSFLPCAVLFRVRKTDIAGWDGRGAFIRREAVPQLTFPLEARSVFAAVAGRAAPFEGALPRGPIEESFVAQLGLPAWPEQVIVAPILVKGRAVSLLYAELPQPARPGAREAVAAATRHTAETLVQLILAKKVGAG
jgi:type II secretion system (T2SS) protein E